MYVHDVCVMLLMSVMCVCCVSLLLSLSALRKPLPLGALGQGLRHCLYYLIIGIQALYYPKEKDNLNYYFNYYFMCACLCLTANMAPLYYIHMVSYWCSSS